MPLNLQSGITDLQKKDDVSESHITKNERIFETLRINEEVSSVSHTVTDNSNDFSNSGNTRLLLKLDNFNQSPSLGQMKQYRRRNQYDKYGSAQLA